MSGKRLQRAAPEPLAPHESAAPHDPEEVARFLREQPPTPIPPRARPTSLPGLAAFSLLGGRVIRRLD